jgi:hypothetical protein
VVFTCAFDKISWFQLICLLAWLRYVLKAAGEANAFALDHDTAAAGMSDFQLSFLPAFRARDTS